MGKLIKFNFTGEFVPELSSLEKKYPLSEVNTVYCTTAPARMKEGFTTDTYLAEAIANYAGSIDTMHLFVGRTSDNKLVCEYQKPGKDEVQLCIGEQKDERFHFKAGIMNNDGLLYTYGEGHRGLVFTMALMPIIEKDEEAFSFLDTLRNYGVDDEAYSKAMCGLSNHIYYRLKDNKSVAPIYYEERLNKLSQSDINEAKISEVICGSPDYFSKTVVPKEKKTVAEKTPTKSLRDMFKLNKERVLSSEEEKRVPKLGDWYVVPEWSKETAHKICCSSKFRKPIRNILLYGSSGTGKTEGSQAIAQMLGLPYYTMSCSADDDKYDLIGQLVPNTNKSESTPEEICNRLGIPNFFDVECDFEGSYEKLFGRKPSKMDTASDCYQEITRRLLESDENGSDFTYVESELIAAIKNGGFCEIQEANTIKRSSVMEALNPLLANGGDTSFIKLPTGEVIHRHPDCVIAFTINRDYEGCNDIQEAVYSRINLVKHIPLPTVEEIYSRTLAQTSFPNESLLKKMSQCVFDINEYCVEKDITGGVCGPRELMDWAVNAMLESEIKEEKNVSETDVIVAAFETVIEKAAQNEDDMEDIISSVFCKHFSPTKVRELTK